MSFTLDMEKIYMAPSGFGSALCAIQNRDGKRYPGDLIKEHVEQYTLAFDAREEPLRAWVPEGLSLEKRLLVIRYERLTNVAWLAGRGFGRIELFLPVRHGTTAGLFRLAAWESNGDSIIQNRDIFGKVTAYADICTELDGELLRLTASNWGFSFLELEYQRGGKADRDELAKFLGQCAGIYHHRYLPKTGERFVNSDADYLVFSRFDDRPASDIGTGTIRWNSPSFEDAPTQHYYLQPLAALELGPCVGGCHAEFDRLSDGYDQTILT